MWLRDRTSLIACLLMGGSKALISGHDSALQKQHFSFFFHALGIAPAGARG
jgi:hypothetical protein